MISKTNKAKTTKRATTKPIVVPKTKTSKRPMPSRSGTAGRKGALGATSAY
jgi:hypothetical protein